MKRTVTARSARNSSIRVLPPALAAGARVAIIAPGSLAKPERVDAGVAVLKSWGYQPVLGQHLFRGHGDLAASDAQRAEDLNWALNNRSIDAIWAARGGWGTPRLLDRVRLSGLASNPKWLIGFSDLTALQGLLLERGFPSLYAPVVVELDDPDRVDQAQLRGWLEHPDQLQRFEIRPLGKARSRAIRGALAGGCLTLLAGSCGTKWQPQFAGRVVLIEEVGEAPYRIDRMLWQLTQSGVWRGAKALVFAQFTRCDPPEGRASRSLGAVLREYAEAIAVPCFEGLPVGHGAHAVPVPLGYDVSIAADGRMLNIAPPFA
jgi:muramoyltetrapeptide carboxypeptidase